MKDGERLPVTAAVLAGGASRRMGRDKAFLRLDGEFLIEVVLDHVAQVCDEVLIVGGDPRLYGQFGPPVVADRYPGVGVLAGLHAALEVATYGCILAVGCDMPFLKPDLLRAFVGWAEGYDVVILRQGRQVEPLHAVYRRACLPAIERAIRAGERRIVSFFSSVRVRYVSEEEVVPFDPRLTSFRNVNTPEEWRAAKEDWQNGEVA